MDDLKQQRLGLLSKEEASDQERFSEDSENQSFILPLRKNFCGPSGSRKGNPFMNLLMLLSLCANAIFLVLFYIMSPSTNGVYFNKLPVQGIGMSSIVLSQVLPAPTKI
jgi:hypothetical protein